LNTNTTGRFGYALGGGGGRGENEGVTAFAGKGELARKTESGKGWFGGSLPKAKSRGESRFG